MAEAPRDVESNPAASRRAGGSEHRDSNAAHTQRMRKEAINSSQARHETSPRAEGGQERLQS
jgi:hypothetical protein